MKANKFVEKFGWGEAKICLLNCASPEDKWLMRQGELICDQDFDGLKRLVESHELVESVGGIISAKAHVSELKNDYEYVSQDAKLYDFNISVGVLSKAIADVESCLKVDKKLEGL